MNFLHVLSSAWELITPFILQAPGDSDGSSEIVSVESCLLPSLISSTRLKGTGEAGSQLLSLAQRFQCGWFLCLSMAFSLLGIASPVDVGGQATVCSGRSGLMDECHLQHRMAEVEPFSDISSLWPTTEFQMTSLPVPSPPLHDHSRNIEGSNEHSPIPNP